jgi:hypothetical protein
MKFWKGTDLDPDPRADPRLWLIDPNPDPYQNVMDPHHALDADTYR